MTEGIDVLISERIRAHISTTNIIDLYKTLLHASENLTAGDVNKALTKVHEAIKILKDCENGAEPAF